MRVLLRFIDLGCWYGPTRIECIIRRAERKKEEIKSPFKLVENCKKGTGSVGLVHLDVFPNRPTPTPSQSKQEAKKMQRS